MYQYIMNWINLLVFKMQYLVWAIKTNGFQGAASVLGMGPTLLIISMIAGAFIFFLFNRYAMPIIEWVKYSAYFDRNERARERFSKLKAEHRKKPLSHIKTPLRRDKKPSSSEEAVVEYSKAWAVSNRRICEVMGDDEPELVSRILDGKEGDL